MFETRVNLKYLLEDIRDSYSLPLEEVIITELVANALDSQAKNISFFIDALDNSLTIVDDGKGMRRPNLKEYHNIAATTKHKGQGIGFAGVGAKLSLLITKEVITETKGGYGSRAATTWHLSSPHRAPWKFIPFSNKVKTPKGTAVTIRFDKLDSLLLSAQFLNQTISKHFLPLLFNDFQNKIFKYFYPKGINFFIEGQQLSQLTLNPDIDQSFTIKLKDKSKRASLAGFGFLAPSNTFLPTSFNGINVSTFGKIIKRGWEWLGIDPTHKNITGLIEMPLLAEILTTNKTDFLQDSASLKKYYRCRKAIQETVMPLLSQMGEISPTSNAPRKLQGIAKDIERALSSLLNTFPELTSLIGIKKSMNGPNNRLLKTVTASVDFINQQPDSASLTNESILPKEIAGDLANPPLKNLSDKKPRPKRHSPKLTIVFENSDKSNLMGRMMESTIFINKQHPAYLKAAAQGQEQYHILLTVAWTLASFIEPDRSPLDFINQFLSSWGITKQTSLFVAKK